MKEIPRDSADSIGQALRFPATTTPSIMAAVVACMGPAVGYIWCEVREPKGDLTLLVLALRSKRLRLTYLQSAGVSRVVSQFSASRLP